MAMMPVVMMPVVVDIGHCGMRRRHVNADGGRCGRSTGRGQGRQATKRDSGKQ